MWILPTRSRPESCLRFINCWIETEASTPVVVRIDECDPKLKEIKSLPWPKEFSVVVGKREGVAKATNDFFISNPNEPWYGFLADDFIPKTKKWDLFLAEAAESKYISYPNDMAKKTNLPTLPCVGGELVRNIGYFGFPPAYHYYVDTIYQYIGSYLNNIKRLENVIVEHLHYTYGKSELDIVYQESDAKFAADKVVWKQWKSNEGEQLIQNLTSKGFKID